MLSHSAHHEERRVTDATGGWDNLSATSEYWLLGKTCIENPEFHIAHSCQPSMSESFPRTENTMQLTLVAEGSFPRPPLETLLDMFSDGTQQLFVDLPEP